MRKATSRSQHGTISVSDTHLDVYKRQLQKDARQARVRIRDTSAPGAKDIGTKYKTLAVSGRLALSVSYTHLDVYKRQVYERAGPR